MTCGGAAAGIRAVLALRSVVLGVAESSGAVFFEDHRRAGVALLLLPGDQGFAEGVVEVVGVEFHHHVLAFGHGMEDAVEPGQRKEAA